MTKRKELATFQELYNEYSRCRDFVKENNKIVYEKVVKVEDEDTFMVSKTKYYLLRDEVFAERVFRDFRSDLAYKWVMFEMGDKDKRKFYKVGIEQDLHDGKIITRYNVAQWNNQEVRRKQLSSDMFDVMSESERNLIMKITSCKDNARYCDYLERTGISR